MVDIHSHILPEVDDGACSWDIAVEMCRVAAQDGITHMVATPHANDEFIYDRALLEALLAQLRDRIGDGLHLRLGCDFHLSYDNLVALGKNPGRFTIARTRYLLVELSNYSVPPWVTGKLKQMLDFGIRPIITHPERNPILQARPGLVLEWVDLGCAVQVTANSLTRRWGERALKTAQRLIENGAVHVIASDCHDVDKRPPVLSEAFELLRKTYGAGFANALCTDNPLAVVENRDMPFFPSPDRP